MILIKRLRILHFKEKTEKAYHRLKSFYKLSGFEDFESSRLLYSFLEGSFKFRCIVGEDLVPISCAFKY